MPEVYGLRDQYTETDQKGWGKVPLRTFEVFGHRSFGYAPGLWKELKHNEYQILHLHGLWMYPHWISLKWKNKFRKPVMISTHGMLNEWAVNQSSWKKKAVNTLFASKSLKSADCLHALTESEYQAIRQYGLTNPVAIIPNGIKPPTRTGDSEKESSKKTLLYLGRLHPIKGLDLLLDAMELLMVRESRFLQQWELKIVGSGEERYEAKLRQRVKRNGLDKHVQFLGPLYDEKKDVMLRQANAFILPSYSEGLPMAVLEAWSYRLPVLITHECHIPEGFSQNAAISLELNTENVAKRLEEFGDMKEEDRNQLAENGYHLVCSRFNWQNIAYDFQQTYSWLIKGAKRPDFIKVD